MITFDEAAIILDDLIEELPDGIYERLNGGVNLIEETRKNDAGDYTMGLYHVDGMGRYIEIFYGSFVELYGDMDQDSFTGELRKVLHHEMTHHVENLAGDRTLEKWDEEQAEKRKYGTIKADSILFVDDDGALAAVRERRATFVEEKELPELERPLVARGELSWRAPDRLEKRTVDPFEERLLVEGDRLLLKKRY